MMPQSKMLCLFIFLAIVGIFLSGCSTPFTVIAVYRPKSKAYKQMEMFATGLREFGDDIAESSKIKVTLTTNSGENVVLKVETKEFVPLIMKPVIGTALKEGERLDVKSVIAFMKAVGVETSGVNFVTEAQEIVEVIEAAAMGPKRGLPQTVELQLISSSYSYEKY